MVRATICGGEQTFCTQCRDDIMEVGQRVSRHNPDTSLSEENRIVRWLVSKAQNGDQQALEELLYRFLPLRKALATYWRSKTPDNSKGVEWEDLIQQIDLLFIEAVLRFDLQSSTDPVLFLSVSLRQDVARWCVREGYGRLREVGGDEIEELMDVPVEREDGMELLAGLTPGQKRVVAALAIAGTQEAAAGLLGVTRHTVDTQVRRIRRKLIG